MGRGSASTASGLISLCVARADKQRCQQLRRGSDKTPSGGTLSTPAISARLAAAERRTLGGAAAERDRESERGGASTHPSTGPVSRVPRTGQEHRSVTQRALIAFLSFSLPFHKRRRRCTNSCIYMDPNEARRARYDVLIFMSPPSWITTAFESSARSERAAAVCVVALANSV